MTSEGVVCGDSLLAPLLQPSKPTGIIGIVNRIKVVLFPRNPRPDSEIRRGWDKIAMYFSIGEEFDKSEHAGMVDQAVERMGLAGRCYIVITGISEEEYSAEQGTKATAGYGSHGQEEDPVESARRADSLPSGSRMA